MAENAMEGRTAAGPDGLPVLGSLLDMRREGVLDFYLDAWGRYGDVARFQMGPMVMHTFVRPEHVRHILVEGRDNYVKGMSHDGLRISLGSGLFTSTGNLWRRQRRLMGPAFTPRAVTRFGEIMVDEAIRTRERWQRRSGGPLAVNDEMMRLTMSIISRSMFTVDIGEQYQEAGEAVSLILEHASTRSMTPVSLPLWVPTPMNNRLRRALGTLDDFLYGIISARRHQPPGDDLLYGLMQARDEETGEVMSEQQLRDEVLIIFFAGHETTALLLTWAFALLAQHPEVEGRLHDELAQVLGGRTPTQDDVEALPYTRMVLDEVLRLYSPVAIMARDVVDDDVVGGYRVPGGSMVALLPYATHRHPDFWARPEAFYPEHFRPEAVDARPRYAYYPFGAGPRICIGKYFALQEAVLVLAELAQRFRLCLAPGEAPRTAWAGTLRPAGDVRMILEPRGD
ncbi:MAG: cytochrome P450 [Anaerolineae bacterium]|jgi:cytochrome P450